MFCAPHECILSESACLLQRKIALGAIHKIVEVKNVSRFEIDRIMAYRRCEKGNDELGKVAIQLMFDNWFAKEER